MNQNIDEIRVCGDIGSAKHFVAVGSSNGDRLGKRAVQ
jgi:hypothetical protein